MMHKNEPSRNLIVAAAAASLGLVIMTVAVADTIHRVSQKGKTFSAKELEISKGDRVSFENDDPFRHNIVILSLGFNSGLMKADEKRDVTFNQTGMFNVGCLIHPKMKMTVIVK